MPGSEVVCSVKMDRRIWNENHFPGYSGKRSGRRQIALLLPNSITCKINVLQAVLISAYQIRKCHRMYRSKPSEHVVGRRVATMTFIFQQGSKLPLPAVAIEAVRRW